MIDKTLEVRGVIISIYQSYLHKKKIEKYLRPEIFDANPNSSTLSKE